MPDSEISVVKDEAASETNKSPEDKQPYMCTDCTLLRCKTGCPASTCPACTFSPKSCSLSMIMGPSPASNPPARCPPKCPSPPPCIPKCPPAAICEPQCLPSPPCKPTSRPCSCTSRYSPPQVCSPACPPPLLCSSVCLQPLAWCPQLPCLPANFAYPPRCPRCCDVIPCSKPSPPKYEAQPPCCPPSCCPAQCPPLYSPLCPPQCSPQSTVLKLCSSRCPSKCPSQCSTSCPPQCPPQCLTVTQCQPQCSPVCSPQFPPQCSPPSPPQYLPKCPPQCSLQCPPQCQPQCPPQCSPICPPQCSLQCQPQCPPQCPPQCSPQYPPQCKLQRSPQCPPQCPPENLPQCPPIPFLTPCCNPCEPQPIPPAHCCHPDVESERCKNFQELYSGPWTWETYGVRIKWTDPDAPGICTVYNGQPILLKLCVEVKPSNGLTPGMISANCWTNMTTMCSPCGRWKDIPLVYQPDASSVGEFGMSRYVYSMSLTPTEAGTAKLTFNVNWDNFLIWANNPCKNFTEIVEI